MADLSGAFKKVGRADAHLTVLSDSFREFVKGQEKILSYELCEDDLFKQEVEWKQFPLSDVARLGLSEVRGFQQISPTEVAVPIILSEHIRAVLRIERAFSSEAAGWGLIAGDVIHNLRSALDHLVFALSVKYRGEPPIHPTRKDEWWRRINFPIRRQEFWNVKSDGIPECIPALQGIWDQPSLLTSFRELQPKGQNFERDLLWVLNELWNWDKHRTITFVAANVMFRGVLIPTDVANQFRTEIVKVSAIGPAEDGAELAILRVSNITPSYLHAPIKMNMGVNLVYDIAFADRPPGYGAPVIATLEKCRDLVTAILINFESEFV